MNSMHKDPEAASSAELPQPVTLDQRLLAESVRLYEDAQGFALDEPRALEKARAEGGDLEQRIISRSQTLSVTPALTTALHQLRSTTTLVVVAGLFLGLLAGATAAQAALAARLDGYVYFFWVLGTLLGLPTLALLLWLGMIAVRPGTVATGFLGAAVLGLGRRLNQRLHRGATQAAAVRAGALVLAQGSIGRWTLGVITHALWLAFLVGCLALTLMILSTKQYRFAWETTILSQPTFITLTRVLAVVPDALGFAAPDAGQIAASQWSGKGEPTAADAESWAHLLVGCILVYGVLPRALLLLLSLFARRQAKRRFRLDTGLAGYARLHASLMPAPGVVDAERPEAQWPEEMRSAEAPSAPIPPVGLTAILGLELTPPNTGWPPTLDGIEWLDLGFVDDRDDRHRVFDRLAAAPSPPRLVAVVCALAATPDRGMRSFILNLQAGCGIPVFMILTEGQHLRERSKAEQVAQRVEDWHRLAGDAQVLHDRVLEVDLDHLTVRSRDKLAALLGAANPRNPIHGHIDQAFELIVIRSGRWSHQPDLTEQAELQRAVARLYQDRPQHWQRLLQTGSAAAADQAARVQTGADRALALLPERLQLRPKWLAAGAMAGALGCVAAATLATPAAIAALPVWAGLGAAVSAALQAVRPGPAAADQSRVDLSEAVNTAALFTLILELQGRDEASISRIIDQVAGIDDPPVIDGPDTARDWLDKLRGRLDQALSREDAR